MHKWTLIMGFLLALLVVAATLMLLPPRAEAPSAFEPTNFEECVAAGYPVMESYPRQCRTPSGQNFVETIPQGQDKSDLIRVSSIAPGEAIASPLILTGEARGTWYFEASFPIAIEDAGGNVIGQGYAQADGEWMTEDFVPFTSIPITFAAQPAGSSGMVVLVKDNPSSLPEHDDYLEIPITF